VLRLIAGARGAMTGLMAEVEDHGLPTASTGQASDALDREGAEQLLEVVRTYPR